MTNRVVDYCGFAARFVGLGYLVLWPLTRPDPFGLTRYCRPDVLPWRFLCHWPHLFNLTPGLQLIGILCAGWLGIHLLLRQILRWRRARAARANAALTFVVRPPQRVPFIAPLPRVKPRSEFGLRASPRTLRKSGVD